LFGNGPISRGLAWNLWRQGSKYDLIHIQTLPYAHFVYGFHIAHQARRPVVLTPHLHVEEARIFDIRMFNNTLRRADLVFAVTSRESGHLEQIGVPTERLLVAGNGICPKRFPICDQLQCRHRLNIPRDAIVLLFLGRKVGYKGLDLIIEAFATLRERFKSLWLVAAGPETPESMALNRHWAGMERFMNLPRVSDEQKLDLLNACDVLLLPSTSEAFGIVFLEAWAIGKPVIGARAGAVPSVIAEEVDGLLMEPNDVASLRAQVERLVTDANLRQRLGQAGRNKVLNRYTVDHVTDIIEGGYRLLIRRND
jgi:glycosyltransferase involved in cell wall biosynthesis